jgi:chromosome partitioning protein
MRLVIGGIKGGTGKTTLATNLAYMRAATDKKVLLVDADEQKSASAWSDQRTGMKVETKWTTIQLSGMYIYEEILKMSRDYDDVIVDTGGRDNSSQRSALTIADIFLMPFRPKAYDIWTLGQLRNLICLAKASNPKLSCLAVINQFNVINVHSKDADEAQEIISECRELTCLPVRIGSRDSFGNAATEGLSIMELSSDKKDWVKKAQNEMKQLYDHIYT